MSHLINLCILQGIFPNCLKTAKVITIHKSGDLDDPTNYRLISLFTPFSKIIEKVLKYRFLDFMEKNKVMINAQYGFKKGVSISGALSNWVHILEYKLYCAALSIDLKKASTSLVTIF